MSDFSGRALALLHAHANGAPKHPTVTPQIQMKSGVWGNCMTPRTLTSTPGRSTRRVASATSEPHARSAGRGRLPSRSATAADIADCDSVDCSKRHVLKTLKTLENEDVVERHAGGGYNGADLFTDDGAEPAVVSVGSSTTNDALEGPNRWSFAIQNAHADDSPSTVDSTASAAGNGEWMDREWPAESSNPGD